MKVAFLVNKFPAISETFVLNQVVGLLDRGHDVHIIARKQEGSNIQHREVGSYDLGSRARYRPSIPDVLLVRLAKLVGLYVQNETRWLERMPRFLRLAWRNRHDAPFAHLYHSLLLLDQAYDVVHCQYGYIAKAAVMLREGGLLASPIVTTFHGYDINVYPGEQGKNCYQRLFEWGDGFTVGSDFARKRLIEIGAPSERIRVWPMGISVDDFSFMERGRREEEPVRLLTVGRLVEEKGIGYAIKAVDRLVKQGRRVRYRVIGDGALRTELEKLVQHLDLEEVVHLLGAMPREDVKEQYEWAHVFVMPGITASSGAVETQGLVLAEAQAGGLPIVATDAGGIPEGVCRESGFLVPEKDVSALAERLAFVADHSERWPDMGRAGRRYVRRKYDVDKLIDELIGFYQQLR